MVFDRNESQSDNTFGTSGKLLNSNLVMYDRNTESYWPQVLEMAVTGEMKGEGLKLLPSHWTDWESVKRHYPDAKVLSFDTGHSRDYNSDPYGSYFEENTYYTSDAVISPVMHESDRFFEKKIFTGVKSGAFRLAIDNNTLESEKVANLEIGGDSIVAVYDSKIKSVRVFKRHFEETAYSFEYRNQKIIDDNGAEWKLEGDTLVRSDGTASLIWQPSFDIMWFVWHAYYPESDVYTDLE